MKQISKRLTYANVMSSIAVFLVLGGAAFAATKLPKNSVGTKQLKNNAVTGAKIKNGTITGTKLNLASLGTVPSATNAANAANASHASNADNASHASNADNASNANTVGGRNVKQIFSKLSPGSGPTVIFSAVGFNIVASCSGSGNPEIELDPQTTESDIAAMGNGSPGGAFFNREQGTEPNSIDLSEGNERGITTFSAAQSNGANLTGTIGYDDTGTFDSEGVCAIYGQVIF